MRLTSLSIQTVYNHEYQFKFNKEAWCMQEMYWYNLYQKKYECDNCQKVVIRLFDNDTYNERQVELTSDVAVIYTRFDFLLYFSKSAKNRKKVLLSTLHEGILNLAKKYGWNQELLNESFNNCKEREFENSWLLRDKYVLSPSKKLKGGFLCNWDLDRFIVTGVILDKQGNEIKREKLIERDSHKGEFIYFTKTKWESDNLFTLTSKNGNEKWILNVQS